MSIGDHAGLRNTADIVILTTDDKELLNERCVADKGLQVLLVKRPYEPFENMWAIPGGFIDHDKPLSKCVKDKLKQKTGIDNIYTEQLYTYGEDIQRDPRDRVITIAYIALTNKKVVRIEECHGTNETAWFWVNPSYTNGLVTDIQLVKDGTNENISELAFDHKKIIIDALNRIANKIMYTDIGFNLVGEEFTIKELQLAYEAVLGRNIWGFRRIIEPKIKETGLKTTEARGTTEHHRPAKLYTRAINNINN